MVDQGDRGELPGKIPPDAIVGWDEIKRIKNGRNGHNRENMDDGQAGVAALGNKLVIEELTEEMLHQLDEVRRIVTEKPLQPDPAWHGSLQAWSFITSTMSRATLSVSSSTTSSRKISSSEGSFIKSLRCSTRSFAATRPR